MKKVILCFTVLFCSFLPGTVSLFAQDKPDGFASVSGKGLLTTTGGEGGEYVEVTTLSDLVKYAGSPSPCIIMVKGLIEPSEWQQVTVTSNKTIVGYGSDATLKNIELHLIEVQNIIIRNLIIRDSYIEGDWDGKLTDHDAIQADYSHHLWIDHCFFTHGADGLIDLRKACDYVTVSYVHLSNHNKAFGLGWTDSTDWRTTIHHCWFDSTYQRNPSFDQGIGHLYNNYMKNNKGYGNAARTNAQVVVQNSVYDSVHDPLGGEETSKLYSSGNLFINCNGDQGGNTSAMPFDPASFYDYSLDSTIDVRSVVMTGSGPHAWISDQYLGVKNSCKVLLSVTDANGKVSPDSVISETGKRVVITAIPNEGFQFDHWNIAEYGEANPLIIVASEDVKLTANFRVARFNVTSSVVGKGSVTPASAIYQIGTQATITAKPSSGWVFDHWEGDLTGNTNPETVTMTKDLTVTAHFKQLVCILTCSVAGSGSVSPANANINIDSAATITATPVTNWVFDHWSGDISGTENPATFILTSDMNIVANFRQVRCNVTTRVLAGKGTIDPKNSDFDMGEQVTLTATPETGWEFDHWTGHITGTDNPVIFNIEKDMKVSAYFVQDTGSASVHYKLEEEPEMSWMYDPTRNVLHITSKEAGIIEVSVFSIVGKKVYSKREKITSGLELPMAFLGKGIYMIRIETNGIHKAGKFVVRE